MCTIVRINIDYFINIRNNPLLTPCKSIQLRSETLIANHKCFTEVDSNDNFDRHSSKHFHKNSNQNFSKWKGNMSLKKVDQHYNQLERLIKRPTINNDTNTHREFISILNKITHENQSKLLIKLKDIIQLEYINIYVSIIWDMMLRCPDFQIIYISVIDLIRNISNSTFINEFETIWEDYKLHNNWIPNISILPNSNDYDEFCDYVKWKKRAIAAINAFMLLSKHNIVEYNIITELTPYIIDITQEYIANITDNIQIQLIAALLEQIIVLINTFKVYKCDASKKYISKFVKNNEDIIPELAPLIKFKMYDIIENLKQNNLYRINR